MNNQTVLIVDDEKSNLKILGDLLRDDVRVILAKSGAQALQKAEEHMPDLILLDIVMPGMSGFEVMAELRKRRPTRSIPVIFVSALGDTESEARGFELGASDYIQKPFQSRLVLARVKLHLQLARQREMLESLANIDPLTSIANRRRFAEQLSQSWRQSREQDQPLSVVMLDVDHFKAFNDHFGHGEGDLVLSRVARALESVVEDYQGFVARYGGEEFVVLLPDKDEIQARQVMMHVRDAIAALHIRHPTGESEWLTVSMGGATSRVQSDCTPAQFMEAADKCLYESKQQGRNCLRWHEPDNLLPAAFKPDLAAHPDILSSVEADAAELPDAAAG
ncbi:diguanylate cyclase domain-containing protein [Pokkaliibacter sp. CJK22405]|uniref:diguanylate cyclase domain-containing protein n=1 Tax=Pokkaliibacter sp. CJK22405 TaxID=3384615 RepID=UPI0039848D3D